MKDRRVVVRVAEVLFFCFVSVLPWAAPALGQTGLDATPVGPFNGVAACPGQPFDDANFSRARTSDAESGFRVFENFFNAAPTSTTGLSVWGIEIDFASPPPFLCSGDDQANFNVAFWGQSGGAPDVFNQILSVPNTGAVETDTGVPFGTHGNIVRYDFGFPSADITGAVWLSVERVNDADGCHWLWLDESNPGTYDDQAYQENTGGFVTSDQTVCMDEYLPPCVIEFDTELVSLNLTGGPFPIPLASDPLNTLPDSVDGYGFVDSQVTIRLSSQRLPVPGPPSTGTAVGLLPNGSCDPMTLAIDPPTLDGTQVPMSSSFDVFFDVTFTDDDTRPGRDYVGGGASITLEDFGPTSIQTFYGRIFDADHPTYDLIPPPEAEPYLGHFQIEAPLGVDVNANGEDDKVKFTFATHAVGDENRVFIELPGGQVIEEFDSAAEAAGLVVDLSTDPPFHIGASQPNGLPDPEVFGGPTVARSTLVTPLVTDLPTTSRWGLILLVLSLGVAVAAGALASAPLLRQALGRLVPRR